jgi:hypothetical protein
MSLCVTCVDAVQVGQVAAGTSRQDQALPPRPPLAARAPAKNSTSGRLQYLGSNRTARTCFVRCDVGLRRRRDFAVIGTIILPCTSIQLRTIVACSSTLLLCAALTQATALVCHCVTLMLFGEPFKLVVVDLVDVLTISSRTFGVEKLQTLKAFLPWAVFLFASTLASTALGVVLSRQAGWLVLRHNYWDQIPTDTWIRIIPDGVRNQLRWSAAAVVLVFLVKGLFTWICAPHGPLQRLVLWLGTNPRPGTGLIPLAMSWLCQTLRPERVGCVHALPPFLWCFASSVVVGLLMALQMNVALAVSISSGAICVRTFCPCGYPHSNAPRCPECGRRRSMHLSHLIRWKYPVKA